MINKIHTINKIHMINVINTISLICDFWCRIALVKRKGS